MTLLFGVLVASLVGSFHCAAMCGGFVCLYSGLGARSSAHGFEHVAYHAGRLVSYLALGLAAGALGARLDAIANLARIERGAAIVAGVLMIVWASTRLAASAGVRVGGSSGNVLAWTRREFGNLLLALRDQPPAVRSGAVGLLTTLLPCGWLYTFVVTAGGTGSAITGAAVMLVFWAGTVPMLFAVGLGARTISRPIARRLPVASAALVLLLGLLSLAGKLQPLASPSADLAAHHSLAAHGAR